MQKPLPNWEGIERVDFTAGDNFFNEGDTGFFFYVVQAGKVEIYKNDNDGNRKVLGTIHEGQAFGEFALITKSPRSASARAATSGHAFRVSESVYQRLLGDLPSWAVAVIESLVQRLRIANDMLTYRSEDQTSSITLLDEISEKIRT